MIDALCLECGGNAIPVQWGIPATESLRAAELGLLHVGGCIVRGEPHTTWWCPACERSLLGPDTTTALQAAHDATG